MNGRISLALAAILTFSTITYAQHDEGPWLPKAEQRQLLDLMPSGVPVSKNLKFYKSDPVYQNMYTMNGGRSKFNVITPVTDVDPWRVSGGMHHVGQKDWRNVTGLDLPGQEPTPPRPLVKSKRTEGGKARTERLLSQVTQQSYHAAYHRVRRRLGGPP